jgi:hypothetical protein
MSDINPDSSEGRYDSSESTDGESDPERWILVLAVSIFAFSFILLALRSVIFSLILITIGISLFAYWLYVDVRKREQVSLGTRHSRDSLAVGKKDSLCRCSICKHTDSSSCLELRCPCCILTRNKQIIGHFNNPLQ